MYGRGVAVSKSDFATYAFALLALEPVAERLKGAVELHFTFDEEIGGLIGPKWLLDRGIVKPDYCISAGLSYSIVTAHNGCLHLQVTVHGKSAHAAAPETGHDALEAMTRDPAGALRRAQGLSGTRLEASRHRPSEPHGRADLRRHQHQRRAGQGDDPPRPPHDPGGGPGAGRGASAPGDRAKRRARSPGIRVEIERVLLASPLRQLPGAEVLIEPIRRYGTEILGEEPKVEGVPLYTDARLYAEAGIPTDLLRRRPALVPGGERPSRRREAEALRPRRRDPHRGAQPGRHPRSNDLSARHGRLRAQPARSEMAGRRARSPCSSSSTTRKAARTTSCTATPPPRRSCRRSSARSPGRASAT